MILYKQLFLVIGFSLILIGCNKTTPPKATSKTEIASTQALNPRLDKINKLIETIDSEAEGVSPKQLGDIIVGSYACEIESFGQKMRIFCFDGGVQSTEILVYYGKDAILKTVIFKNSIYNASPANLEAFDESKTSNTKYKIILNKHKDPMYCGKIQSVYDANNKEIPLTEEVKSQWSKFTAAIPPY